MDLARVGSNPILECYGYPLNMVSANHQAVIANILLMCACICLIVLYSGPLIAPYTSGSIEIILSHLSTRVMDAIPNGDRVRYLIGLLGFIARWEKMPACLTPMAYEWCSTISEVTEGLRQGGMRINEVHRGQCFFDLDMELAHVEPVHPDNSRSHGRPLGQDHEECVDLILRTLEVGFRLADISRGRPALGLNHTSHHDRMFEAVFSCDDDHVIADAVGVWIAGESKPALCKSGVIRGSGATTVLQLILDRARAEQSALEPPPPPQVSTRSAQHPLLLMPSFFPQSIDSLPAARFPSFYGGRHFLSLQCYVFCGLVYGVVVHVNISECNLRSRLRSRMETEYLPGYIFN